MILTGSPRQPTARPSVRRVGRDAGLDAGDLRVPLRHGVGLGPRASSPRSGSPGRSRRRRCRPGAPRRSAGAARGRPGAVREDSAPRAAGSRPAPPARARARARAPRSPPSPPARRRRPGSIAGPDHGAAIARDPGVERFPAVRPGCGCACPRGRPGLEVESAAAPSRRWSASASPGCRHGHGPGRGRGPRPPGPHHPRPRWPCDGGPCRPGIRPAFRGAWRG